MAFKLPSNPGQAESMVLWDLCSRCRFPSSLHELRSSHQHRLGSPTRSWVGAPCPGPEEQPGPAPVSLARLPCPGPRAQPRGAGWGPGPAAGPARRVPAGAALPRAGRARAQLPGTGQGCAPNAACPER